MPDMNDLTIALLTILMSGVTSAVVTYSLNARREELDMLRNKAEVLFEYICTYENQLYVNYRPMLDVLNRLATVEQAANTTSELMTSQPIVKFRIDMLIAMYFPRLDVEFEYLLQCGQSLSELSDAIKKAPKDYRGLRTCLDPSADRYNDALMEMGKASVQLQSSLVLEVDRASKPFWMRSIF